MAKANNRDKETEIIRVRGDVYDQIAVQAEAEERTKGGQVAFLVRNQCSHPLEERIPVNIVVAPVLAPSSTKAAQVGKGQPFRGYFCSRCRQYLLNAPVSDEIASALSAPVMGKTSK